NTFINQVGLNPVFTLLKSTLDDGDAEKKSIAFINEDIAQKTMANLLHADSSLSYISPIARRQKADSTFASRNIVLVLMEKMSANNLQRFVNTEHLTPVLDSLASNNWSFDNIYSAGLHTYNGIYSTLFSHPAIMQKHSMDDNKVHPVMAGFPNILRKEGYQTI